ncbi:MAG TPA: hydantoinase B/oxoprolinase family protein [Verrucomicrobiales bacterium]|nr:hydantoinase B/oxoprolinase family protein [Verrucomicrobiales bacterium]
MSPWLIAADRGGTFTDCLAREPMGRVRRCKVLSRGVLRLAVEQRAGERALAVRLPEDGLPEEFFRGWQCTCGGKRLTVLHSSGDGVLTFEETMPATWQAGAAVDLLTGESAPIIGTRLLTHTPLHSEFPEIEFRLATTLATNALLEGTGARTALFITKGFADLPEIGDQRRADLFALGHVREPALYDAVVEVSARMDAKGGILAALDGAALRSAAETLAASGFHSAAVALMHSDVNAEHEEALAAVLREAGFTSISLSSRLAPVIRLLPRTQTAVVNAVLAPVMNAFVESVRTPPGRSAKRFYLMASSGGLEEPEGFHPKDSLLSGPAGGVRGCAALAKSCGVTRALTLDMGGTSTDVARWDGGFLYQFEQHHGRSVILAPSLRIETVAAGGGSICDVTGEGLTVGPRSAGADPGPACYGGGGPLTLTDVNLLLGRLDPARAGIPLSAGPARERLTQLKAKMAEHGLPVPEDDTPLLRGLLDIAVGRMAEAVRRISVRDGCDPAQYTLIAFGGAGPQHACAIAEQLGMKGILVARDAGVLSASGALHAPVEAFAVRQMLQPLAGALLHSAIAKMEDEALSRLGQGQGVIQRRIAELRLRGQNTSLAIDFTHPGELDAAYRAEHARLYGYELPAASVIELVSLRAVAAVSSPEPEREEFPEDAPATSGPDLIQDAFSTLVIEPGWQAVQGTRGTWRLTRAGTTAERSEVAAAAVAELFRCRFQGMVDAMGGMLKRTAISTNVKERMDYSCALLDAGGHLVMNAPHIPVHLGALGECVRRVAALLPPQPGDVFVTNDPAFGGSHLPDVTVLCPVFGLSGNLLGWTANRAHHAEIGGITPGSMPAEATCLAEEGVVIPPMHLVRGGKSCEEDIAALLTDSPWPTRALADNLADLRAQLAAARHGAQALLSMCESSGEEEVSARLASLTTQAREAFARRLARAGAFDVSATEHLDDGTPIAVRLKHADGRLAVDFTGSGAVHPGNRNATTAIVRSAVLYVLRLWTGEAIPLNEGMFDAVDLIIPEGILQPVFDNDPRRSPAVVGGNVETSQRLVDTLIRALELEACSQGTMNNVIFGNASFGHYETIGGGAGAGPDYHGLSAVHTHMTNTAITDPEIIERRYPVRIEEFSIRRGSGGAGRRRGGDGIIRSYRFLEPLTVSLLTEHRTQHPFGMKGGKPGTCGRQTLIREENVRELPGTARIAIQSEDLLKIETPGGGGWGA